MQDKKEMPETNQSRNQKWYSKNGPISGKPEPDIRYVPNLNEYGDESYPAGVTRRTTQIKFLQLLDNTSQNKINTQTHTKIKNVLQVGATTESHRNDCTAMLAADIITLGDGDLLTPRSMHPKAGHGVYD